MIATTVEQQRTKATEKLPQALRTQKEKLLIALNQAPDKAFSEEDEQSVNYVTTYLVEGFTSQPLAVLDDSKVSELVKKTLKTHTPFQLSEYLICAENVCIAFSNKNQRFFDAAHISMQYVLAHSRQFGDPSRPIFKNNARGATTSSENQSGIAPPRQALQQYLADVGVVKRVQTLIAELKEGYDETKFRVLNAHITSFALVLFRRNIKQQIQDSTGHNDVQLKITILHFIIIAAYLNTDDEKTKKNMQNSCVKYMEWYDLQLPYLFHKVLDLYRIDASELWDLLFNQSKSKLVALSLINMATVYYATYKLSKADPPMNRRWFAFCRLLRSSCSRNLADSKNKNICYILNLLVEMKDNREVLKPNNYSTPLHSEWAQKIATEIYTKINK